MNKVFVLIEEGAIDGDHFYGVDGVFADLEHAKKILGEITREAKNKGWSDTEEKELYFETWIDGEYNWNHWRFEIVEEFIR